MLEDPSKFPQHPLFAQGILAIHTAPFYKDEDDQAAALAAPGNTGSKRALYPAEVALPIIGIMTEHNAKNAGVIFKGRHTHIWCMYTYPGISNTHLLQAYV